MEKITRKQYREIMDEIGTSYIGSFNQSAKLSLNGKNGVITYAIYLAPYTLASCDGLKINTCPAGQHCSKFCLNGSGQNKPDILSRGTDGSRINRSRIKKTQFFYRNKEKFMLAVVYELENARKYAEKHGMGFSVRLNCTSDISPLAFKLNGQNILEMFPDVQFYDYTKVANRYDLVEKYDNYQLTFSYDGYNWDTCEEFLNRGINVAVVFESKEIPISWRGYGIIDMTQSDLRYLDQKTENGTGYIGYLHFHRPATLYKNGKYERPDTPFVVTANDAGLSMCVA